ncbi:zinc finger protein 62-like [Sabethes cyaneus]|uniref:zinc finger protein 62-like n=1 Tax=Sabethes cyaneus TaxID=53552 RepID=UPI00237D946B|nr:zinc finger protein 62-like [Sabethes cyaneus]
MRKIHFSKLHSRTWQCRQCNEIFTDRKSLRLHKFSEHDYERPHECSICGKAFALARTLELHSRYHTGEGLFQCEKCDKKFNFLRVLKQHQGTHEEGKFPCNDCGVIFRVSKSLQNHACKARISADSAGDSSSKKPDKRSNECDQRGMVFNSKANLRGHYVIHIGKRSHKCNICGKAFLRPTTLKYHLRLHGDKIHKCHLCDKKYSVLNYLNRHLMDHQREKHKCDCCGKEFILMESLQKHSRQCTGPESAPQEKTFKCDQCCKVFANKWNLKLHNKSYAHTKIKRPASSPLLPCAKCDMAFESKWKLKVHYYSHTGGVPYKCETCGKSFTSNLSLKNHSLLHSEHLLKCEFCDEKFTMLREFECHRMSHPESAVTGKETKSLKNHGVFYTNQRPHKCNVCGKSYIRLVHLNHHMRIHTGDLFKCDRCGTKFATNSSKNKHLDIHQVYDLTLQPETHTDDGVYRCDICYREFVKLRSWQRHYSFHKESQVQCELCDQTFAGRFSLLEHTVRMHRDTGSDHTANLGSLPPDSTFATSPSTVETSQKNELNNLPKIEASVVEPEAPELVFKIEFEEPTCADIDSSQ